MKGKLAQFKGRLIFSSIRAKKEKEKVRDSEAYKY